MVNTGLARRKQIWNGLVILQCEAHAQWFWATPHLPSPPSTPSLEILFFSQITFRPFWSLCCWMLQFGCSSYAWKWGVTLFTFCCLHYHNAIITIQFTLAFPDLCFNGDLIQATKRACLSSQQKSHDDSCLLRSLLVYSWSKNWTCQGSYGIFAQLDRLNIPPAAARPARPVPMALEHQ